MPGCPRPTVVCLSLIALVCGVGEAAAQRVGAFRWQLQPFCNVVTLSVAQDGAVFTLDGYDDQCGAGQRAAIVGTASLNPDGSVGMGFAAVSAPGGTPIHIDARISVSSLGGPWRDSAGNAGTFVFTPGPGVGGPPRPVPSNGIAPGSITAAQIAPGAVGVAQLAAGVIGAAQINPNQVQTRVAGACPVGQYLRGIHPNGAVICESLLSPNVSTTVDDPATVVGRFASIAIGADGLPIISHHDDAVEGLRVTHCGNATCTANNLSTTVDDQATIVGIHTSIAIGVDGLPIISHRAQVSLRVTHCGNAACTAGNVSTTVDAPANGVGLYTSIAIGADGLPIISHLDDTAHALRVTHCGNVACTAGNVSNNVDDPANFVGLYTSIAIGADGLPVISHQDDTADALRVTHCGNVACTAGNVSTNIDDQANIVGVNTSIAIGTDGLPIISHYESSALGPLRVTHCGNAACTAGNVTTPVSSGFDTSIAIGADGLPIISHRDGTASGVLRVTHCGNASCTAGTVSTTVDIGHSVFYTSIAIGTDGLPIIAYHDDAADALRVTKCATKTCQ